jgi:putative ABC transport system substrate-binding protein
MRRRDIFRITSPRRGEVAERSKIARRVRGIQASQNLDPPHPDLAALDPTSPHPNSGLPEFGTLYWPKPDKSDFGWGEVNIGTGRREFIALLGGTAAAFPLTGLAQTPERTRRIGILMGAAEHDLDWQRLQSALEQELRNLGWIQGRNLRIDYRWPGDDVSRTNTAAIELVELGPEIIVTDSVRNVQALRRRTDSIPIIFVNVGDPVGNGLVPNLARPGGSITGFTAFDYTISEKWLDIIKELAPRTSRIALVFNPETARDARKFLSPLEAATPSTAIKPVSMPFRTATELELAIGAFARAPNGALLVAPDTSAVLHRRSIIDMANRNRLPAVYPSRFFAIDGGLVSYGIDTATKCKGVASYIDRILRGQSPGDIPVQAPAKFELVVNAKTAKALGISVPPALLARANEVIE